jgi:hypothetical protein
MFGEAEDNFQIDKKFVGRQFHTLILKIKRENDGVGNIPRKKISGSG